VEHFLGVLNDITQTKRYQEQLEHQATHDTLTGLPNRAVLIDRMEQAMAHARSHGQSMTVVLLDLDGLKHINDGFGHGVGDRVLQMIARRLKTCMRRTDTVARLGGDAFVLLFSNPDSSDAMTVELQTVLDAVAAPLPVDERELYVTATLGVCVFPDDGQDATTLLRNADIAMYRAKELGGNTFEFYREDMAQRLNARLSMLSALRHAVERDELHLQYQPRVDLRTGAVVGVEALLRWNHPEQGAVSPADFIPLAEESGLIESIGNWVMRTACRQAVEWTRSGLAPVTMAVNLSARQFARRDVAAWVATALDDAGLQPRWLELELTESVLMADAKAAARTMVELKRLGVSLAIDDFGTGYSSLSYLKRFPVDRLKIDRSFVRDLTTSVDDAAIAKTIIALGRTLNMRVVAEGVETAEQAEFLRHERCDEMQGFLCSRPLPPDRCFEWIEAMQEVAAATHADPADVPRPRSM
jgi:diguanylate cyclase (GGDEF)-like protein